jgi:hypothetical protein
VGDACGWRDERVIGLRRVAPGHQPGGRNPPDTVQQGPSIDIEENHIAAARGAREPCEQDGVTLAQQRIHADAGHLNPERAALAHHATHEVDEAGGGQEPRGRRAWGLSAAQHRPCNRERI